mmetsp:Transcript_6731/g.16574  ORF Transcript_6731/g.16574 Transcript_6731/m.16574 type:complete len:421 (-) Transcript_6731:57-1319(-)
MMGRKPRLVGGISIRRFAIVLFIGPSLIDAVDSFTPQIYRRIQRPRSPNEKRCYSAIASGNKYGGIGSLHVEQYNKIALRHPRIAERISFVRPVEEWLNHYLSLSDSDQKKLYSRWPNGVDRVNRIGRERLHEWIAFFLSDTVGLDHSQLRKMLVSRPQLLTYKLSNMQCTASYFREELGLSSKEFGSLLNAYPSVLMYSINDRLRPTVNFLQNECGGGKDNWASWKRVIYSYPNVFSHSLEKTLLPKVNFLCSKETGKSLSLKRSELSQVVAKFPPTLWLSEVNLQSKFDFLSESLGLNRSELRTMIVSYPQMLGLSLENNIMPKMDFFLHASVRGDNRFKEINNSINCGLSKNQLKDFVLYQPALLAYSLESRLKPRISRMQAKNILFSYCPKNIMSYTDEKFDNWMSTQVATWSISE